MRKLILIVFIAAHSLCAGAFNPDTLIDSIVLKNGQTLKNVKIVSFASTSVMAKWEGGRGTIQYSDLPNPLAEEVEKFRPKPTVSADRIYPTPSQDLGDSELARIYYSLPARRTDPIEAEPCGEGPKRTVTGQCFVTTKGGQNFKLGGVVVRVFEANAFKHYAAEIERLTAPRRDRITLAAKNTNTSYAISLLQTNITEGYERWLLLPQAKFYSETDADGNFSITHNLPEPYVIFATAMRAIGKETEHYVWSVGSEKVVNPNRLFLNNANMR